MKQEVAESLAKAKEISSAGQWHPGTKNKCQQGITWVTSDQVRSRVMSKTLATPFTPSWRPAGCCYSIKQQVNENKEEKEKLNLHALTGFLSAVYLWYAQKLQGTCVPGRRHRAHQRCRLQLLIFSLPLQNT